MAKAVMADSISYLPEFKAWYTVFKQMLSDYDLGKLLVYVIDDLDASALPFLAEQFDVLGWKGWRLAKTESDQRELLKRAIELHRYKGTEWAIIEALKSIGFDNAVLKSGVAAGYDHWAKFGIDITNLTVVLTADSFSDIIAMVNEYKRKVCVLVDVSMGMVIEDTLTVSDDVANAFPAMVIDDKLSLSGTLLYDGSGEYDGTYDHSGDSDIITITPI